MGIGLVQGGMAADSLPLFNLIHISKWNFTSQKKVLALSSTLLFLLYSISNSSTNHLALSSKYILNPTCSSHSSTNPSNPSKLSWSGLWRLLPGAHLLPLPCPIPPYRDLQNLSQIMFSPPMPFYLWIKPKPLSHSTKPSIICSLATSQISSLPSASIDPITIILASLLLFKSTKNGPASWLLYLFFPLSGMFFI